MTFTFEQARDQVAALAKAFHTDRRQYLAPNYLIAEDVPSADLFGQHCSCAQWRRRPRL